MRMRPDIPVKAPRKSNAGMVIPGGAAGLAMEPGIVKKEIAVMNSEMRAVDQKAHGHPVVAKLAR
jgi:hypothetical protein